MPATPRPVDLLTGAFDLNQRRQFNIKKEDGTVVLSLYFKPITRADRKRASGLAGSDEALDISTQMHEAWGQSAVLGARKHPLSKPKKKVRP